MRLLLSLFLLSSFVQRSWQDTTNPSEVSTYLQGGFPIGSLLTVYLKKYADTSPEKHGIAYDLYERASPGVNTQRLHFRVDYVVKKIEASSTQLVSSVYLNRINNFTLTVSPTTYVVPGGDTDPWWRFDLYKINDTTYLPFVQGCNAGIRTLEVIQDIAWVYIRTSNVKPESIIKLNFDKNDVYLGRRLPNKYTPTPAMVMAALDQSAVAAKRTEKTPFGVLDNFSIGTKIKLSALLLSTPVNRKGDAKDIDKNYATLYFFSNDDKWAFGIANKYNENEKKVKMYLFASNNIPATQGDIKSMTNIVNENECTGASSSTDLVHVKLMRPTKNLIKMRIYYKGDALSILCEITVDDTAAALLDQKLTIKGVQSATLLHLVIV